jgi:hypothetical protein
VLRFAFTNINLVTKSGSNYFLNSFIRTAASNWHELPFTVALLRGLLWKLHIDPQDVNPLDLGLKHLLYQHVEHWHRNVVSCQIYISILLLNPGCSTYLEIKLHSILNFETHIDTVVLTLFISPGQRSCVLFGVRSSYVRRKLLTFKSHLLETPCKFKQNLTAITKAGDIFIHVC